MSSTTYSPALRLDISIYNLQCMAARRVQIVRAVQGSHTIVFTRQHVAVSRPPVRAVPRSPALHSLIPQPKQCSSRHGAVMCPHGTNAIIICFVLGLPVCWRWRGLVMMNKCDSIDRAEEVTGGALLAHCPTVSTTTTIVIANITSVSQILPV